MIIIAGYARTGTSIIFECLKNSGFYCGPEEDLSGHYYKSQYRPFNGMNRMLNEVILKTQRMPLRFADLPLGHREMVNIVGNNIIENGIEVLKDPQSGPVLPVWIDHFPEFSEAKFIRTIRNPRECAKSNIRRAAVYDKPQVQTFQVYMKTYAMHNMCYDVALKGKDKITVRFEYLLKNPEEEGARIAEFIDHDFDISMIDPKMTWQESRMIH